ncbi:pyridoxal phosphate-dependent aminotransferase [Tengunoibacter tsumagoiensis]|uniref:pyridoxal phosphate-dependent aminotransferase n=1 Tax=Tengunoibacter tsumagoiensis TaxID=2014871 RepID=UPI001386993A|nr:pyridoxal phosphate-dependent aminotransferase [Tengunoibacter tsumagoiensis]
MNSHTTNEAAILSTTSFEEQRALLRQLRTAILQRFRPLLNSGAGPIRMMARVVEELKQECYSYHIAEEIIQEEIVNRTIGDINLRLITECEGEAGSSTDYRMLADELGLALPGEDLAGYTATGETYQWLRAQMMEYERLLLANKFDLRVYDIYAVGNPIMREWLAQEMQKWGYPVTSKNIQMSLGAMDGIDRALRGLAYRYRVENKSSFAMLCPEPGFGVPEWQASTYGYRIERLPTLAEHHFKLSADQLDQVLQQQEDISLLYFTITNNPTAFAYTPEEIRAINGVLNRYRAQGREIFVLADLAYIGTGKPEEDYERMAAFNEPETLKQTIFVSSFSKNYTLTGERFGWVTSGDPEIAAAISVSWSNGVASLPGEWQLRFMAYYQLFQARPWLADKLRSFYRLRRTRFIAQLHRINAEQSLFEEIYVDDDATVYNWSKLKAGEDAFSLFEKTGIAGVPGSGFGYTDEYIRFSIGVIPIAQR